MKPIWQHLQARKLGIAGLMFIAYVLIGSEAQADCCNTTCCNTCTLAGRVISCSVTSCANCSTPGAFSCCGVGSCNIFCCNCDGGCLGGNCQNCGCEGTATARDAATSREPSYWFKKFDTDKNDSINLSEAMRWGQATKTPADQTRQGFKHVDTSGDGGIDLREFSAAFKPPTSEGCPEGGGPDPAKRFAMLDRDHNGGLSLSEIQLWAKENRPNLGSAAVKKGFEAADRNADGLIQPAEFDRDLSNQNR